MLESRSESIDSEQPGQGLSPEESSAALTYINDVWADIKLWRKGLGDNVALQVEDAVYAFEGLINVYAGNLDQTNYERAILMDSITVPAGIINIEGRTWTGTQSAAVYDAVVTTVNNHLSNGPGTTNRLVVVDVAQDPDVDTQWWITSVVESNSGTPILESISYEVVWGPEDDPDVVPPGLRIIPGCSEAIKADDIIQAEVSSELKRTVPPLSIVIGLVRTNPGGPVGTPSGPPRGIPVVVDLSTYDYPTGSTNFANRGQFRNHSDFGRQEICFTAAKITAYSDDGEFLARNVVQPLVPRTTIRTKAGKIIASRVPFLADYLPGGKSVLLDLPGDPVGFERFHDAAFFFGAIPLTAEPAPNNQVLSF